MKTRGFLIAFCLFLGVTFLFFYPSLFHGFLPFPGDLLVGHYAPWNSYSFLGYAPGGVPHKAQGIDVVRELFPWRHFSVEMIKSGELPFWNPYNFSGNPHLANFQTAIFYPLSIIFLLFPFNLAWTVFIFLQPLLACCFTYLLAREFKISRLGSFLASIAFAFCLYFTVWIEYGNVGHSILWLPLALFLVEKIIKEKKLKWNLLLIFCLTFSILAGYVQATIYLFGTVFVFFFFRLLSEKKLEKQKRVFKSLLFLGSLVFPFFLCSFQFLPTLETFSRSAREAYPPEKIPELLLPWFYPVTSFASDFFGNPASRNYWILGTYIERVSYIGVLPLFFAFLAFIKRRKEKIVLFFVSLAAISLLFTLNLFPIRFFYGLKIPIISTTVYTRLLSLFSFSMAILAGFGIDFWLKAKQKKAFLAPLAIFGTVYLFLWAFTFLAPMISSLGWEVLNLDISQKNLILPTGFFLGGLFIIAISFRFPKKLLFWGIFGITVFDLFFYFHKITPFSPPEFVYPKTTAMEFLKKEGGIYRFWGYGTAYIDTNFSTFDHTFSPEGNDPLLIRRYGELISASDDGKIKKPIPRADAILPKGYGPEALRKNPYRQRMLNLLGVKYLFQKNENLGEKWLPDYTTFPEEIYELVWQEGYLQIYENKTVLPRIFLVGDYQVEKDKRRSVDLIFDSELELDKKLILEEKLPADFVLDSQASGTVKILSYQPNEIKIETTSSGNQLLFLSDSFYLNWQVSLDGKQEKIYRANYAFRAVLIPEGKHQVIFSYQTNSFKRGVAISGVAFIGLLSLAFFYWKKRR